MQKQLEEQKASYEQLQRDATVQVQQHRSEKERVEAELQIQREASLRMQDEVENLRVSSANVKSIEVESNQPTTGTDGCSSVIKRRTR